MQFEPRSYQTDILETAKLHNTLVVLPTGLGKTAVAMMLAEQRITQYPDSKVLVLAPTKPLVEQHYQSFSENLPDAESLGVVLTGRTKPENRAEEFAQAAFIFSTPQTIENDLLGGRITLTDVSLLVIDEAHRATGEYAYVQIAHEYAKQARHERVLALTASPGSQKAVIEEVIENCRIEKLEVRSDDDPDVAPYVQEMDVQYVEVELHQDLKNLKKQLEQVIDRKKKQVESFGIITDLGDTKGQLLRAQRELQGHIRGGDPEPEVWRSISVLAEILKAEHALELLETQGLESLESYLDQMRRQAEKGQSKAVKNLVSDPEFKRVDIRARTLRERGIEHPKLLRALSIVKLELAKNPSGFVGAPASVRPAALPAGPNPPRSPRQ